jgi:anaerobic selenocysteine-containing dehydrogenase
LDLLVTVDPFPSETAQLAHYVIAPVMHLERPDTTRAYEGLFDVPFAQYTPALMPPPEGVIDDWEFFLRLAWAADKSLTIAGREYAPGDPMPTTDEILSTFSARARVSLDEVKAHPHGKLFDAAPAVVAAPPSDSATGRFALMPSDVADELQRAYQAGISSLPRARPFHLAVRRTKETMNTFGKNLPGLAPAAQNPCHIHPDDVAEFGLADGALVTVTSDHGSITTTVKLDPSTKRGVVSITHGFGVLPNGDTATPGKNGANVNQLLSMRSGLQSISAMPVMSGVPVSIEQAV